MAQAQLPNLALPEPQAVLNASQVVPNSNQILERYPVVWQGSLSLKNNVSSVDMHFLSGSVDVVRESLPMPNIPVTPIHIKERMKRDIPQLELVTRKLQQVKEHCILVAVPRGDDDNDLDQQSNGLSAIANYLEGKLAAGIYHAGTQENGFVLHFFPSCEFSNSNLATVAPSLVPVLSNISHMLIVITTV